MMMESLAYRHRDEVEGQSGKIGKAVWVEQNIKTTTKIMQKKETSKMFSPYIFFMAEDRMQWLFLYVPSKK